MPDWAWTLIAQMINVAILVLLLRRFLYQPVRKALAGRRERVNKDLDDATSAKEEAESLRKTYEERLKNAEAEAESIEATARENARSVEEAATDRAKEAAEKERKKALEALEREKKDAERALRTRELDVALILSRKILESATGPALASMLASELADRVRALEEDELPPCPQGKEGEAGTVSVLLRTSHEPSEETKENVRRAFADRFGLDVRIETRIVEGLLCGVEAECKSLVVKSHMAQRLEEARRALEKTVTVSP